MIPLIKAIEDAKVKFKEKYNMPPEVLHVSFSVEKMLNKWAKMEYPKGGMREAEVLGMGVLRATKSTPHAEFWLTAIRNSRIFTVHARLTPEEAGGTVVQHPGETIL